MGVHWGKAQSRFLQIFHLVIFTDIRETALLIWVHLKFNPHFSLSGPVTIELPLDIREKKVFSVRVVILWFCDLLLDFLTVNCAYCQTWSSPCCCVTGHLQNPAAQQAVIYSSVNSVWVCEAKGAPREWEMESFPCDSFASLQLSPIREVA